MTLKTRTNWVLVGALFGPLVALAVVIHWMPATLQDIATNGDFGLGYQIGANFFYIIFGLMRGIVALIIATCIFWFLPPISRRFAFVVTIISVGFETLAQLLSSKVFGENQFQFYLTTILVFTATLIFSAAVASKSSNKV